MYIIIVGGGRAGYYLTKDLLRREHEVTLIERDERKCQRLQDAFGDIVLQGDCDPELMKQAGVERADVLISVTGTDETNLVVALTAKQLGVPRVIARVFDPKNREVFQRLGVNLTVSSTEIICNLIEQEAVTQEILPLLSIQRGELEIVEVHVPVNSPAIDIPVRNLPLPVQSNLICLIRGEEITFPRGNTSFHPNDTVVALTSAKRVDELKKVFYP